MSCIQSIMVEFHRVGDPAASLEKDREYVRTFDIDGTSDSRRMPLGHRDFVKLLRELRYPKKGAPDSAEVARETLATHAFDLLSGLPACEGELVQLDVVANVSELWAFPFEAALAKFDAQHMVLTRRIRGGFSGTALTWPARPKVLFLHADATTGIPRELIDAHERALRSALEPWSRGGKLSEERYAQHVVFSAAGISKLIDEERPTHVHMLAHGTQINEDGSSDGPWGLSLGNAQGLRPEEFAQAVTGGAARPVVVTLAACDSGNVGNPALGHASLAQDLHRRGVPVVVASQLPLTHPGSVVLARAFYTPLLCGADVRRALFQARRALEEAEESGHDWLSLVGYVRLPEGYQDHVLEVGLRAELGMLDAAQAEADRVNREGGSDRELEAVEKRVRARLDSLRRRRLEAKRERPERALPLGGECAGLIASSNKRLAELLFQRQQEETSKAALQAARTAYREAYEENQTQHWCGVQCLALDGVLTGGVAALDWRRVQMAAEFTTLTKGTDAYWAFGSLAELYLLSPLTGGQRRLDDALAALRDLKQRAPASDPFPLESTRRQLQRYVSWWTKGHGFFAGTQDLAADAQFLLEKLPAILGGTT
jgi:hypothetical protein